MSLGPTQSDHSTFICIQSDLSNILCKIWRAHFLHFHHGKSTLSSSSTALVCSGTGLSATARTISIHWENASREIKSSGSEYWRSRQAETIRMQWKNVYRKSFLHACARTRVRLYVCVCVYMGGSDNYKVWYKVSRKNSFFVAILTCVNAKYILSICFWSRTDCSDWSGSKRTHSWYIIGNKRFMASFSGPRSSGFLYL